MKELVFHRFLLPAFERCATRTGFHDGGYHATFEQHGERVLRLGNALEKQLGVSRGDRFAVMALNSHEYMEICHAAYLGSGIFNPLNMRLAPPELQHIMRDSGTEVVFVDATFAEPFARAIEPVRDQLPLRSVVLIGDGDVPHDVRYDDLIAAGEPTVPPEPDEEDPSVLVYTGGTTGLPKGVVRTQRADTLLMWHAGLGGGLGYRDGWAFLHHSPLFHITGLMSALSTTSFGEVSVILPGFEPGASMAAIERYGVQEAVLVATMMAMVLDHPEFRPERLASLRRVGYGAMPMPPALLDRALGLFPDWEFIQGYGLTETGVLTLLPGEDHHKGPERLRSVGRATPGVLLTIQDDDGNVVASGEEGEICVRGGNLMSEYWGNKDATDDAFRGGWFRSGDVGRLDEEGYLYLVDRARDMIVSGGENVYSIEVENAICTHPAVAQVAVIGIPHDTWGEQVHAIVVAKPGMAVTEEEIQAHARQTIAGYKVPKSVELRTEPLPLSAAMKPLKRDLRAGYWKDRDAPKR